MPHNKNLSLSLTADSISTFYSFATQIPLTTAFVSAFINKSLLVPIAIYSHVVYCYKQSTFSSQLVMND